MTLGQEGRYVPKPGADNWTETTIVQPKLLVLYKYKRHVHSPGDFVELTPS